MMVLRNCPNCGHGNSNQKPSKYSNGAWHIKTCPECGFTYLENAPSYDLLIEDYAWERTSAVEAKRRRDREPIKQVLSGLFKQFRRHYLKRDKLGMLIRKYVLPGNVLDVGCAAGNVMMSLDEVYVPHGVEISKALALRSQTVASERSGYVIHDNALAGLKKFPSSYFSGILMSAFLEHEIAPRELLEETFRCLHVGGCCIVKVPNFGSWNRVVRGAKWCGFRFPDHVNYFTPMSLAQICKSIGFNILRFNFIDRLPTSDNMWIVIQKRGASQC